MKTSALSRSPKSTVSGFISADINYSIPITAIVRSDRLHFSPAELDTERRKKTSNHRQEYEPKASGGAEN
jgi:hypothetical protein